MKIVKVRSEIDPALTQLQGELKKVPPLAHKFFFDKTPKRTGNARSHTRLRGDTISAEYPYAIRLDKGWSKQAPNGMSRPTKDYIRNLVAKIIRKR